MKIAIFYPRQTFAGWYALGGYQQTLTRMGHEVIDCPLPGNQPHNIEEIRAKLPTIADLDSCHAVISFYHEYTQPWLRAIYTREDWSIIVDKVVARFDESMDRADLELPGRMSELLAWANHYYFPAAQDAKKYGGTWLPFGADVTMFHPRKPLPVPTRIDKKKFGAGFVGSLYQSRLSYLQQLASQPGSSDINFQCGQVGMYELGGMREPESTHMLREAYQQISVFFCLPPMSRLIVAKVFDVMACGTFVMYPRLPGEYAENLALFENGKHIVY